MAEESQYHDIDIPLCMSSEISESGIKKQLWGGEFWTDGYYVSTVGQRGSEETIRKYVQEQGD